MFGSECVVHHARNTTTGPAAPPPTPCPHRLGSSPPGRCLSLLKENKGYSALYFIFIFLHRTASATLGFVPTLLLQRGYISPHMPSCVSGPPKPEV